MHQESHAAKQQRDGRCPNTLQRAAAEAHDEPGKWAVPASCARHAKLGMHMRLAGCHQPDSWQPTQFAQPQQDGKPQLQLDVTGRQADNQSSVLFECDQTATLHVGWRAVSLLKLFPSSNDQYLMQHMSGSAAAMAQTATISAQAHDRRPNKHAL